MIRQMPSLINGLQFVAQFGVYKTLSEVCYLLINKTGEIENISSTCMNMLSLDN